ncbi:hypothetical protein NDU88_007992 [Pleurodeles waltl]|uniref:Uncharacterized protein n=1 Tax=Pleurodeles waltl TaxID=8319 RepID=A0AAV7N7H6_PLEWA|nr:hypothetical protein NDU88_007992 [Pleurodeles waltl]
MGYKQAATQHTQDVRPSAGFPRARPIRTGPPRHATDALFQHFEAVRYHARPPAGPATPDQSSISSGHPRLTAGPHGGRGKASIGRRLRCRPLLPIAVTIQAQPLFNLGVTTCPAPLRPSTVYVAPALQCWGRILGRCYDPGPEPLN